ncbi:MAG: hypothetical protein JWN01_1068 [Patescibacteria group bacterium]|jgi:hypothetical protein|nr:hypothetical protein [Patescibacteria group bacterium]
MIEADYFARKRQELGFDRMDALQLAQAWLDAQYPKQARAKKLHQGVLRVVTPNASVASELRMRQVEFMAAVKLADTRLAVSIGTISEPV